MANFLTTSESSVADADANAYALASATRRKNAAYNALSATYGPAAGDPDAQAQLIANDTSQQTQADKINASSNASDASDLALDQAQRADTAWQGKAVLDAVRRGVAAGQDPGAALDTVSHYLPSLGVDPAHVAPLADMIRKDPKVLDQIGQQLGPLAAQSKIQGQPIYTQDAQGKYHISYAQQDGTLQELKLPDGQSVVSSPDKQAVLAAKADAVAAGRAATSDAKAEDIAPALAALFPGVRVTGMGRTADKNAAVGGVADSMHLSDKALDFVLPEGVTAAQAKASIIAHGYPITEFIDEPAQNGQGAHVHWGWAPKPTAAQTNAGDATVNPQALKLMAETALKTGKDPAFSGAAGAIQRAQYYNEKAAVQTSQGLDADAVVSQQQAVKERGTAVNDLGKNTPNSAGGRLQSAGALINHIGVFNDLVTTLGSGNIQAINAAQNAYKTATGSSAPTNLALAKTALGDEAAKFIAVANVGKADREEFQKRLDGANSMGQLRDASKVLTDLAAGQLGAMRQRYSAIGATKEFDAHLTPSARKALGVADAAPAPQAKAGTDPILAKYGL